MAGRRRTGGSVAAFKNEDEIYDAIDAMEALPTDQQAEVWRELQPRVARYILANWGHPVRGAGAMEWALGQADCHYRGTSVWGKLLRSRPPKGYVPDPPE